MNEMLLAQMLAASAGRNHHTAMAPMLGADHCCALGALLLASGITESCKESVPDHVRLTVRYLTDGVPVTK